MKRRLALLLMLVSGIARAQEYTIAGRVVNAETGAPLPAAQVTISPSQEAAEGSSRPRRRHSLQAAANPHSDTQSVLTGPEGAFHFDHVPAGKYTLSGTRRGFITASYQEHGLYSTAIVAGDGLDSEGLTLRLSPGASISGTITDSYGDPVEQANISLYRQQDDGLGNVRAYRTAQTNDLGGYEFSHLEPGTYFVSASGHPWYAVAAAPEEANPAGRPIPANAANLDVVYQRSYYADAADSASATPIAVRGGEQLRIDLRLNAVPAVHLTVPFHPGGEELGDSSGDQGRRGSDFGMSPQLMESVFGQMVSSGTADRVTFSGGPDRQTITLTVAPGEYQLADGARILPVNASSDAQVDLQGGAPAAVITGRVAAVGGGELPHGLTLTLAQADGRSNLVHSADEHDGNYTFEGVPAGEYEMSALAEGHTLAVAQIAASGAELDGHVLKVGSRPVTFAAMLAPAASVVAGVAEENGHPASGVMVVLVPQELRDPSLYRRDQSDSDGSFSMRDIAAGRYTLVAIRDGWELEWAKPEVITHYLPGGEAITVTGAPAPTVHPVKRVAVQPR